MPHQVNETLNVYSNYAWFISITYFLGGKLDDLKNAFEAFMQTEEGIYKAL